MLSTLIGFFITVGCNDNPTMVNDEPSSNSVKNLEYKTKVGSNCDPSGFVSIQPSNGPIYVASLPYMLDVTVQANIIESPYNSISILFDGNLIMNDSFGDTQFSYAFSRSVNSGTHTVQVIVNTCKGKFTALRNYNVQLLPVPGSPTLVSPSDNSLNRASVNFNWSSNGEQTIHQIVIDDDSSFSTPVYNQSSLTNTSKTVTLRRNKTYYWKVRSSNESGTSSCSAVRTVRIRPETPNVSGTVQAYAPRLNWSSVSGATQYQVLRISHSYPGVSNNSPITGSTYYLDTSIHFPVERSYGRRGFSYRVVAISSNGWKSEGSNVIYFEESKGGRYSRN